MYDLFRVIKDKYEHVTIILRAVYGFLQVYYGWLRLILSFTCKLQHINVLLRIVASMLRVFSSPVFFCCSKKKNIQFSVCHHSTADIRRENMAYERNRLQLYQHFLQLLLQLAAV